mmetsp:Transcript_19817/g.42185  ORF Transcript_19817/g.42185 Transcript_19817/m.42185 type:complete len:289 (-) Transcript_19817:171-1037(-)
MYVIEEVAAIQRELDLLLRNACPLTVKLNLCTGAVARTRAPATGRSQASACAHARGSAFPDAAILAVILSLASGPSACGTMRQCCQGLLRGIGREGVKHQGLPHVSCLLVQVLCGVTVLHPERRHCLRHLRLALLHKLQIALAGATCAEELRHRYLRCNVGLDAHAVGPTEGGVLTHKHDDLADEYLTAFLAVERENEADLCVGSLRHEPALLRTILCKELQSLLQLLDILVRGCAASRHTLGVSQDGRGADEVAALHTLAILGAVTEEVHEALAGIANGEAIGPHIT